MKKQFLIGFIAVTLAIILSFSIVQRLVVMANTRISLSNQEGFRSYRERLTDPEQYLYGEVLESLKALRGSGKQGWNQTSLSFADYSAQQKQRMTDIYNSVLNDHPIYTMYVAKKHNIKLHGNSFMLVAGDCTKEEEAAVNERVVQIISRSKRNTTRATIKRVYDYLATSIIYDDNSGKHSNDLYGAIVEKKAQCGGISYAFKYILDAMNVENRVATGYVLDGGSFHMWNEAVLNGKDLYYDLTWQLGAPREDRYCAMNAAQRFNDVRAFYNTDR